MSSPAQHRRRRGAVLRHHRLGISNTGGHGSTDHRRCRSRHHPHLRLGIEDQDTGRVQNRRVSRWSRSHARATLGYRLAEVGIAFTSTDERGTSSRCPTCGAPARKSGRVPSCTNPTCRRRHHCDVAGAQNMIGKAYPDHEQPEIAHIEHRRVGSPARRDRRRVLFDLNRRASLRSLPVSGPPGSPSGDQESLVSAA